MIFLAVTQTKRKRNLIIKIALLLLLLCLILPSLYGAMTAANSMEYFAGTTTDNTESFPGEPMRVNGEAWVVETQYWDDIASMLGVE